MNDQASKFASEDDEAQHWLAVLRDGPNYLKGDARLGLARIFERRGQLSEAVELVESCVAAGLRTPVAFEWLARLYDQMGNTHMASQTRAKASSFASRRTEFNREVRREVSRANAEARAQVGGHIIGAILSIAVGVAVTVGSYWQASQAGGGRYFILYGLVIFGVILLFRGIAALFPRDT